VKPLRILSSVAFVIAAMVASSLPADAKSVHLVATIHGSGGAVMDAASPLKGTTTYSIDAQLFSDGTATGFFDCADLAGSTLPGDIQGPITSWKRVNGKITLSGIAHTAKKSNLAYTVAIQKFGGAGKGHWTLDVPFFQAFLNVVPPVCSELLTSGRLVIRHDDGDKRDSD
jgi:hypothetical protein